MEIVKNIMTNHESHWTRDAINDGSTWDCGMCCEDKMDRNFKVIPFPKWIEIGVRFSFVIR